MYVNQLHSHPLNPLPQSAHLQEITNTYSLPGSKTKTSASGTSFFMISVKGKASCCRRGKGLIMHRYKSEQWSRAIRAGETYPEAFQKDWGKNGLNETPHWTIFQFGLNTSRVGEIWIGWNIFLCRI
jgi:hypothetical protein